MSKVLDKITTDNAFESMIASSLTPKAAVSYLRVSTHDQAERGGGAIEGFSIPAQREANKKKAASIGAIVIKEFVDRGASARSAARPELQRMLEYINENKNNVDFVIVHKIDRLARNRGDDVDISRVLEKAGVKLVSTTESIDETPSGMLLHGIMSSIAEFYSRNLSNEVLKGMSQKVKNGGTGYRAPLGYKNIRTVDDKGRENRTVIIDEDRAPLIRLAYEYYSTGDWSIKSLAEYLALRGLTTLSTPKVASKPIDKGSLNNILVSPYYKGLVSFQGVFYPGSHPPLVDEKTWQNVQYILELHLNGERTREHPHFLKSTVYCAKCGARLLVHRSKSHTGAIYPYFICATKHSKRGPCNLKSILIEEIERKVELLYTSMSISHELRQHLEEFLCQQIKESADEFARERKRLGLEKDKLERKRAKLLEAHYADAIPLDLLKSEQIVISKALLDIEDQVAAHNTEFEIIKKNLAQALSLIENCGQAYKLAPDKIKKAFNQAIFEKILVDDNGKLTPKFNCPFDILLDIAKSSIQHSCGSSTCEANSEKNETPCPKYFFGQGVSKGLLVENTGLEPATSYMRSKRSPRLS